MKPRAVCTFAILVLVGMSDSMPVGAITEQVPVGPRAIAMGSAFTAIADDNTAIFWNPAGLVRVDGRDAAGWMAPGLYGTDLKDTRLAYVQPILARRHVLGADWYHSGFTDPELEFTENRFSLAYAYAPDPHLSIGIGGKYLTRSTSLDGIEQSRGSGFGLDFGVLGSPLSGLRVGAVVQDALQTSLRYDEGGSSRVYPRNVRVGAAYQREALGQLAFDMDDRWHLGVESAPVLEMLQLRLGLEKDRHGDESPTVTGGAGLRLRPFRAPVNFRFDFAYVIPPSLPSTSHLGISIGVPWTPPLVRMAEPVWEEPLYVSLQNRYAARGEVGGRGGLGLLALTSVHDTTLTAEVDLSIPALGIETVAWKGELRPNRTTSVPLSAEFGDATTSLAAEVREVDARLRLRYVSGGSERRLDSRSRVSLWRAGYLDWNAPDGARQAGAFVTPKDSLIGAIGNEARQVAEAQAPDLLITPQLRAIVAGVDALAAMDVRYSADPRGAFGPGRSMENPQGVARDWVKYPRETLADRRGDCDDTTVLLASLLENMGVHTQFVDLPPATGRLGHIFLLAETGLGAENRWADLYPPGRFVLRDEELWLPIETTALGRGFAEAWAEGARSWAGAEASGNPYSVIDVGRAMDEYPALTISYGAMPPVPEHATLAGRVNASSEGVRRLRDSRLADLRSTAAAAPRTVRGLGARAFVHHLGGEADEALRALDEAIAREPHEAWLHTNRGTVLVARGELERGYEEYRAAFDRVEDATTLHNLACLHAAAGDTALALRSLRIADGLRGGGAAGGPPVEITGGSRLDDSSGGTGLSAFLDELVATARRLGPLARSRTPLTRPRLERITPGSVSRDEWMAVLRWREENDASSRP